MPEQGTEGAAAPLGFLKSGECKGGGRNVFSVFEIDAIIDP